ncbi:MAG TPA: histidine kinase dimerization/phospho-acceptor domain-containing protein [Thermoanaerobaculia bacterium]|nr:histidine kinase dimerization/phospho-acceptor domain-containing protein [Thermoanaerobaculia bacterium]
MNGETMERWLESFANAMFERSSDTAHDLKTPLNVAVLNLELLKMRVQKLTGGADDEKLNEYAAALETELRRMARIFDTFFVLSTPPPGEGPPQVFDAAPLLAEVAEAAGYGRVETETARVTAHEARIRQALKMFFDGAAKALTAEGRRLEVERSPQRLDVVLSGAASGEAIEPAKLLKFYYTDALGNPDVSLAAARLIAETYGGELNATDESDNVSLRLTLPLSQQQ